MFHDAEPNRGTEYFEAITLAASGMVYSALQTHQPAVPVAMICVSP